MNHYSFITTWRFSADVEEIWPIIQDVEKWPLWWKGVKKVDLLTPGEPSGLGKRARILWRSILPYSLVFELDVQEVTENKRLHGITTGELTGTGTWLFEQAGQDAVLTFYWDVYTTKPWMNFFGFFLRPLFIWNHSIVMKWGQDGLTRKLNRMN